jgi:hypothetical protein
MFVQMKKVTQDLGWSLHYDSPLVVCPFEGRKTNRQSGLTHYQSAPPIVSHTQVYFLSPFNSGKVPLTPTAPRWFYVSGGITKIVL